MKVSAHKQQQWKILKHTIKTYPLCKKIITIVTQNLPPELEQQYENVFTYKSNKP